MSAIDLNSSVFELCRDRPNLICLFHEFGTSEFDDPSVREGLGPVLRLRTLLAHRRIDSGEFIARADAFLADNAPLLSPRNEDAAILLEDRPTLLALFPCGMKAGLDGALLEFANQSLQKGHRFHYRTAGNVNHELSFYPFVDSVESEDELPDVILSADLDRPRVGDPPGARKDGRGVQSGEGPHSPRQGPCAR